MSKASETPNVAGLHAYLATHELDGKDYPFYTLVMSAMKKADSQNVVLLRAAFPNVWHELQARYYAPGGRLEGEKK